MGVKNPEFITEEIYHIVQRGVDDRRIFEDESDYYRGIFSCYEFNNFNPVVIRERRKARARFKATLASAINDRGEPSVVGLNIDEKSVFKGLEPVEQYKRDLLVSVWAVSLMPNHFHLLVKQLKDNGITIFMTKMGGYAYYFNKKYNRMGHLFKDNFKAVHIEDEEQLKNAFVYVHTNPISLVEPGWKEKGIQNPQMVIDFLENYKWSSYPDYLGKKNFPSVTDRNFLLEIMGGAEGCRKFVEEWVKYKGEIAKLGPVVLE